MKHKLLQKLPLLFMISAMALTACRNKQQAGSTARAEENPDTEYVKTGSVERLSPELDKIIPPGELPEIIAEGFDWTEGPLWLPDQDILIFSDIPENSIFQWSEEGGLKLYLKPSGYTDTVPRGGETGSNALLLDPGGRLVLCQHGDRRMAYMDAPLDNPAPKYLTLADNWEGKRFNSPNDAVYNSRGDLFFTDPAYGMEHRYNDPKREMDFAGVFKLSADGELSLLIDDLRFPNGIGLSPDETKLYVANSGAGEEAIWMVYDFNPDGTLSEGRIFCDASGQDERGAPDGFKVREDGVIFATGPGGLWILSPGGEHLGTVKTGQATSNCALDDDGQYLYMTADMHIMRIRLK